MSELRIPIPPEMAPYKGDLEYFVATMVRKLYENAHKGKWENIGMSEAMLLLDQELDELMDSLRSGNTHEIAEEAADAANFCLIISSMVMSGRSNPFATRAVTGRAWDFLNWAVAQEVDYCLVWPFRSRTGPNREYGQISKGLSRHGRRAHHVACALAHGEPPSSEHQAEHLCGNSLCVNPRHLKWSVPQENQDEKREHGTNVTPVKLNWDKAREIRERYANGEGARQLAVEYGVSYLNVYNILNNKVYKEELRPDGNS